MKKIILLVVLLTTIVQLTAMDAPGAMPQGQIVTEQLSINELPDEIKEKIALFLANAKGENDYEKLFAAVKNIRAFARTNRSLYSIVNNPKTTDTLIRILSMRYTGNNPILTVAALKTTAALEWFNKFLEKAQANPIFKELLQKTLAASLTKYPNRIVWWIAEFIVDHVPASILQLNLNMAKQILLALSQNDALRMDSFDMTNFLRLEKIVNYIIASSGIDINRPIDANNRRPAFYYALAYNSALVKILLDNPKFDINKRDVGIGETPLSSAVYFNRLDAVKVLLAHNADINAQDNNEMTALMHAVVNVKKDDKNSIEIIKLLLNRPDLIVNERDVNGDTAFDFLLRFSPESWDSAQREVADMLLLKGAKRGNELPSIENESENDSDIESDIE